MANELQNKVFHDETKARRWLESHLWPDGPVCGHCGSVNDATPIETRSGLYQCNATECRKQFTVTVGTLFERSHIPLTKWLMAAFLFCASKKGMSSLQLSRMLGVSYKSTWFMMHRIREAMRDGQVGPIGGRNKVVEADETYVGGKAKNRAYKPESKKQIVMSLVEREGEVRSFHVENATAKTLSETARKVADRKSYLMTDENAAYTKLGKEFSGHGTVNHSANEYARLGNFIHTNTAENYFSLFKRGVIGTYHHISEQHLDRYLAEFDFRYNNRVGLGVNDSARSKKLLKGIVGKRLTYRRPDEAAHT
ncbi:MAG: IS1595 family transposase [Xanthobacteraceae bacterium]